MKEYFFEFFDNSENVLPANNRLVFKSFEVNSAIESLIKFSNTTNQTDITPRHSKNFSGNDPKGELSISIPTNDSLHEFITWELGDYLANNVTTTDVKHIQNSILNLLITTVIKNINPQLTSCKSNDLKVEKEQS